MKTRPEYREATKEGKPKSMMGRSAPGATVSVGFRPQKTIPGDGKRSDLNPSPGSPVWRMDCTNGSWQIKRLDVEFLSLFSHSFRSLDHACAHLTYCHDAVPRVKPTKTSLKIQSGFSFSCEDRSLAGRSPEI